MRYNVTNANKLTPIPIGRAGENEYTEIAFDISEWLAELGTIDSVTLFMKGSQDSVAYLAELTIDGSTAVHTITYVDLRFVGFGTCQLVAESGSTIVKSPVYQTRCFSALDASPSPEEPFGPYWIGTQAEYDALPSYNSRVLYYIVEEVEPPSALSIPAGIYTGIQSGVAGPIAFDIAIPIAYTQGGGEFHRTATRLSADLEANIIAWWSEEEADLIGAYISGGVFIGGIDDEQFTVTESTQVSREDYDKFMAYFAEVVAP